MELVSPSERSMKREFIFCLRVSTFNSLDSKNVRFDADYMIVLETTLQLMFIWKML